VRWGGLQPESYEITATGRILFWRGGSLWIGLAGEPTGTHAQHAVQIALRFPHGLDRRFDSYPAVPPNRRTLNELTTVALRTDALDPDRPSG
jgi:hypothetical protein